MYIESAPPEALTPWIQSRSLWRAASAGSLWLPADPSCEIKWCEVGGEIQGEVRISPPSGAPGQIQFVASEIGYGALRLRPEALEIVRAKLERRSRFGTGDELQEWLCKALDHAPDERLGAATAMLRKGVAVENVAERVGWSPDHLRRRFQQVSEVAPSRIQSYARLRRATLIARKTPAMSLEEIAFRTGYSEASALARACLRQTGQTFRQFSGNFQMPE